MKQIKFELLPHFDKYTVDFNALNRPSCFHLFWNEVEVATIRLEYDANGYLNKAIREGTRKQRLISLRELGNLPFFTAYIHRINLIDLISEITNIKNIESVDLIDLITRIALIDNITNVGTLNLLNTVNLIKSISSIDNITSVDLIDSITNIGNIDVIKNIVKIQSLDVGFVRENPIQNPRFTSGFDGWRNSDADKITIEDDFYFGKCVKFNASPSGQLIQYLSVSTNIYRKFAFWAYKPAVGGANIHLYVRYTDDTYTEYVPVLTDLWTHYVVTLDLSKTIRSILLFNATGIAYFVLPMLIAEPNFPREDLLLKDIVFASNVALQQFLAAVVGQKHKIFAFGFECDADGAYYFSATVNGSAFKFGRRMTKGIYAQTLVNPVVCDVNTALNFMSNGGNTQTWIQYKTEA